MPGRLPVRSLIGARRRTALSTVNASRVNRWIPQNLMEHINFRQAVMAMIQRHLGCISDPSKITDMTMVHQ